MLSIKEPKIKRMYSVKVTGVKKVLLSLVKEKQEYIGKFCIRTKGTFDSLQLPNSYYSIF